MAYGFNEDKTKEDVPGYMHVSNENQSFYNYTLPESGESEHIVSKDCFLMVTASSANAQYTPVVIMYLYYNDGTSHKIRFYLLRTGLGGNGIYAIFPGIHVKKGQKLGFAKGSDTDKIVNIVVNEFSVS